MNLSMQEPISLQFVGNSFLRAISCDDKKFRLFTPNYSTMNVFKKQLVPWPVTVTIRKPVRFPITDLL